jgi:hypothetical protein
MSHFPVLNTKFVTVRRPHLGGHCSPGSRLLPSLLVYFFFFLHKSLQSVCSFRYILSMTLLTLNPQRPPSQSPFLYVVALFALKRTEIQLQFRSWPRLDRNTWHEAAGAIPHMYVPPASLRRGLHRTPGSLGGATAALCSHGPWPSLQSGQAHSLLMHWFY